MRGKRVKWIRKLVINTDPAMLLTIRKYYGERTQEMRPFALLRAAKKLWKRNIPEREYWGKPVGPEIE